MLSQYTCSNVVVVLNEFPHGPCNGLTFQCSGYHLVVCVLLPTGLCGESSPGCPGAVEGAGLLSDTQS